MGRQFALMLIAFAMTSVLAAQTSPLAKDGIVRAAYLASNPAQAVKDPVTGEARGVVVDLARELERTRGIKVTLIGLPNPQRVIDAVRNGEAEIGFVAYNPERAGPVEFSKPYLLVNQTFIVKDGSPIRSIADIDRPGRKLGATRADSIALYLKRTMKQGQVVELDDTSRDAVQRLLELGTVDAFGANRQRLTDMVKGASGFRLLNDDLYGVEQTIIVGGGRRDALDAANQFIDEVRRSGFLRSSVERSGVVGITVAPER
ncbi:MAG TPA: transporter substrate-binding domain-containing protein [Vicinamibacterales bacterium]|jgi:polar amino acid transport system substrate-binding protein|nr:transporter substrate-binding domain-containing protein [Vicinamibacterales bacterium]